MKRLFEESHTLSSQGNYDQAEILAKQAVSVAEKTFGPDHPKVGLSLAGLAQQHQDRGQYAQAEPLLKRALAIVEKAAIGPADLDVSMFLSIILDQLASLYETQGQYSQAEPLYKRSLAIIEKALGPDNLDVVLSLNHLAGLYKTQGQYAQAEPLYKRALAIREALGPDSPSMALNLKYLANLYKDHGQYAQAEPLYKRALAIEEKALGPDHPFVALALDNLASLFKTQRHYAQAEPLYKRSLAIMEKALGPDHPDVAASLNSLASLYYAQGHYAQAEPLYKRALAIEEKALGPDHLDVAQSLNGLAVLYDNQGQYAQSEQVYKRSLAIREKALGPDHPDVAQSLHNLAMLYLDQGQYAKAEPLQKRSLAIIEKARGPEHPDVATSLNSIASLYKEQGQYVQAEPLYMRALAIREKALGPDHPDVAHSLHNLANLYSDQNQVEKAEQFYQRSLAIMEKALGLDHPDVAASLNSLANMYKDLGHYAQAEPLYKRALAIEEKALGPDHSKVATSLYNLATLNYIKGQYAQAEPLYLRSLAIREKAIGPDHQKGAQSLNGLAVLYGNQGQYAQAILSTRRASAIYRQRIIAGGTAVAAVQEASQNRAGFLRHLLLLAINPGKEAADKITDEAFQIAQLEQASGTASAIAKMAARFAGGNDTMASLIKRKQDASDLRVKWEAKLVSASGKSPEARNVAAEQRLRDDIADKGKEIETIDAELTRRFPEYQELTRSEPVSIGQVQKLLQPGEAMLVYTLGGNDLGFLWVVKPDGADFLPLKVDVRDVAAKVSRVRSEMEIDDNGRTSRVSVGALHDLYHRIFAPAAPLLAGVRHVMVVPAGSLQSLPFSMLVASAPPEIKSDADYRQVDWLAKRYAFSVLPSVSSIQAFRQFAKGGSAKQPFAGFGDPLIGGTEGGTRGKRGKIDVAGVYRSLVATANAKNSANFQATEIADVEEIRQAPRLTDTADELRAMAKTLSAGTNSLWLQAQATETIIKGLDLSKFQTIAFATHGVMAGEVKGVGEPGLILTPPKQGTLEDDGYLSAGEIAKLNMNADWVVLSACNTAAADGTPGAEGLSGLAKAFFYAGARSLLVSHWPVASQATVPLTTVMLAEYKSNSSQGKAEAHRKSMLALMNTPDHPEYAHPLFWAPFVVVGEGGAGTPSNGNIASGFSR